MSTKAIIISALIFVLFTAGISVALTAGQKAPSKTAVVAAENVFDFGEIKVSDVKEKDFVLKNTGTKPLQILNINSSCNCTAGKIIYNNSETKEYGMHAQSGYLMDILPGTQAIVKLIYRPFQMPVYGAVEREIYVTTNDPQREKIIFSVKAYVK